ncbi:DUF5134 domain-containing protein [Arthrobacter silvisoli]|uniref:DUF5134 domain-containing protein n=1 Tax=Arthrobacter silvisoli TaxID=2291022 RepID=UPI001443EF01|nr:DUF5134 domain-containing protein [Arthrobacter silvisoli]
MKGVIGVFSIPALNWALTAVLLLGAAGHLARTVRTGQATDRVNNALHALMHLLMAAMLWNLAPATLLAQITLLAGAALWFTIQAVARPEFPLLCTGTTRRLGCAYHALSMSAAALMIALMAPHTTPDPTATNALMAPHTTPDPTATNSTTGTDPMPMPMTHAHHHTTAAATAPGTPGLAPAPALALAMTVLFATAAVVFTILHLRKRTTRHPNHPHANHKHPTHTTHALEALGATAMALMSATMTT